MAATVIGAGAQTLHQEITVTRDITPTRREATRLSVTPAITLPTLSRVSLKAAYNDVPAQVKPLISFLEPAAYADTLYTSPYRGYVAGALFPGVFNAGLSAGYRIVDTDRYRLSAWMQYNGNNYRRRPGDASSDPSLIWRDNTVALGADLRISVGKVSTLRASADYLYSRYNNYLIGGDALTPAFDRYNQSAHRLNFDLQWLSRSGALRYSAGAGVRSFGYGTFSPELNVRSIIDAQERLTDVDPVKETAFNIVGKATLPFGEISDVHLGASLDMLHHSEGVTLGIPAQDTPVSFDRVDSKTNGLLALTPGFSFNGSNFKAGIGVRLDVSFNAGKAFHIAPDVNVAWTPSSFFAIEASATGGVVNNSLSSLWDVTPYQLPAMIYDYSNVPLDLDGRITIGPFRGAYVQFFGGWAKASDWLMPVVASGCRAGAVFDPVTVKGYRLGAAVGYKWRDRAEARLSYTTAPGDYDEAYYRWRDRARHVLEASVKVNILENLSAEATYSLRAGRKVITRSYLPLTTDGLMMATFSTTVLHNSSDLSVKATYRFTDRLSFFLVGENLLDHTSYDISLRPDKGISGLIGASLKF